MVDADKYLDNAVTTAILMDAGIALMRQNIRRRHPGDTETEIDALLSAWLRRANDPIPVEARGFNRSRNLVEALMNAWYAFRPNSLPSQSVHSAAARTQPDLPSASD